MSLPAPLAIAVRTLTGWLDDRLTIAAIGLFTGKFWLGDAQWDAVSSWVVALAGLILVLIPDPRKRAKNDPPPIELQGRAGAGAGAVRAVVELRSRTAIRWEPGPSGAVFCARTNSRS